VESGFRIDGGKVRDVCCGVAELTQARLMHCVIGFSSFTGLGLLSLSDLRTSTERSFINAGLCSSGTLHYRVTYTVKPRYKAPDAGHVVKATPALTGLNWFGKQCKHPRPKLGSHRLLCSYL
jgi:hypothetical protein